MAWKHLLRGWETSGCTRLTLAFDTSKLWDLGIPDIIFCPFSVVQVKFPRFYGYSHMTIEPLKNSYQTFQITVEFKVGLSHPFVAKEEEDFFFFFLLKFVFCTG